MKVCAQVGRPFPASISANNWNKHHCGPLIVLSGKWYRGVLDVADRLPVVVRISVGPRVSLTT